MGELLRKRVRGRPEDGLGPITAFYSKGRTRSQPDDEEDMEVKFRVKRVRLNSVGSTASSSGNELESENSSKDILHQANSLNTRSSRRSKLRNQGQNGSYQKGTLSGIREATMTTTDHAERMNQLSQAVEKTSLNSRPKSTDSIRMFVDEDISFTDDFVKPAAKSKSKSAKSKRPQIAKNVQDQPLPKSDQSAKPTRGRKHEERRPAQQDEDEDDEVDTREMNRRSPNGFLLPDPLPKGEVLHDIRGQEWCLGKPIGVGGFGELYLACQRLPNGVNSPQQFVVKVEPHTNGPLFVEIHFYLRAAKMEQLEEYRRNTNLGHLGVPRFIACGSHVKRGQKYRFLVMERFGSDLQRIIENSEGCKLTDKTILEVTLQVLHSLQYIHSQGYVHKDVKASNLLVGLGQQGQHLVHLVDYGLCSKYVTGPNNLHKQYTHDLRWAHEGTLEYTSRDSHIGSASRRGDLEVLLYNLVEWWGGVIPWDRELVGADAIKVAKFRAFADPVKFLTYCFRHKQPSGASYPPLLLRFMKYIGELKFEEKPDYDLLRGYVIQEMHRLNLTADGRLEFRLSRAPTAVAPEPDPNDPEWLHFMKPVAEGDRISAVFDRMCVNEDTWVACRDAVWDNRNKSVAATPTQAMTEVMERIKFKRSFESQYGDEKASFRKRHRSGYTSSFFGDWSSQTPAMQAVARRMKMRQMSGDAHCQTSDDVRSASLLPAKVLPVSTVPTHSVLTAAGSARETRSPSKRHLEAAVPLARPNKELARLDSFLTDPETRRRTRSTDVTSGEITRNIRSAIRVGLLGNVRTLVRQFSDSFASMF